MTTLESRLWDRLCQLTNDGATPLVKDQFLEMVRTEVSAPAHDEKLAKTVEFRVAPGGFAFVDDARHRKELMYPAIQVEEYIARLHAVTKASNT